VRRSDLTAFLAALCLALCAAGTLAQESGYRQVHFRLEPDELALGRADAPLTLVEFTDYQCPYCRHFQAETFPRLKREFIDTGKVRFIMRDLPLDFHPQAQPAAEAAHCAAAQGKFWPVHDALLANGSDSNDIERAARAVVPDMKAFEACRAAGTYRGTIAKNLALARSLGLDGTPAFVVGRVKNGELTGWPLMGDRSYEDFAAGLNSLLAQH
jgi:protein-disulfide isomerase